MKDWTQSLNWLERKEKAENVSFFSPPQQDGVMEEMKEIRVLRFLSCISLALLLSWIDMVFCLG